MATKRHARATEATEIDGTQFEKEVLQSSQPVLVAFGAPWSHPCRMVRPALNQVAQACAGHVKVVMVNADNSPNLGLFYEIQSVPTLLYFVAGTVRARMVGTVSKQAIFSQLKSVTDAWAAAPDQPVKEKGSSN